MTQTPFRARTWGLIALAGLVLYTVVGTTHASDSPRSEPARPTELWAKGVEYIKTGRFGEAYEAFRGFEPDAGLPGRVRGWLEEFEAKQLARKEANKADFEKYVKYTQQRMERKEYREALGWVIAAKDVADDVNTLLRADWLGTLVNDALLKAEEHRKANEWREAWYLYSELAEVFEREPRYQKLEREAATHLRLENMFKKKSHWREYVENATWADAKTALEYVEAYYVVPADFKRVCESGLEQLIMLTESQTARESEDESLKGLKSENDRDDFVVRVRENLEQVRAMPRVDRSECVKRFRRVVETINPQTLRLPEELIVTELLRGAFEPLDEFTTMIWPKETEEFEKHTRGDFIGVGISIIKNQLDEIEVVSPLEDTPAYAAGVQAGDIIAKVDGKPLTSDMSINSVVDIITGPKDTPVTLTIRRDGKEIEFPLVRAKVKIQSVKGWRRDKNETWNYWVDKENGIAYIRLASFQRNTAEDLVNALSELQAQGMKGLILDLRWNPGGLLDSAWQIASLFLKRGDGVVSTRGRIEDDDQRLDATRDGPYMGLPLVVLADQNSASASEIVSGAIRDNKRGVVIGERTFGKFSVQNLMPLGSSRARLKLTTARYFLPSGVSLHREPTSETWGVEPNIRMPLVTKERIRASQLRREADLLGPPAPKKDQQAKKDEGLAPRFLDDENPDDGGPLPEGVAGDESKKDDVTQGETPADGGKKDESTEKLADGAKDEGKDKLPPIEQPDENERPKEDYQVEAALLFMRVKLLAEKHPTLATAEVERPAKP